MAVKDPVCGMILSEEKAPFSSEYGDKTYRFCGRGCKERFDKDPEKYLSGEDVDWIEGQ
ncbi:MAG: YHS domain-containing protein [Thermodesulfobacteriota bacterium]